MGNDLGLLVVNDGHTKFSRPHFTKPNGELLYHGISVPEQFRRNAARTHVGHIIPELTEQCILEALVYSVAAQYTGFSRHAEALRRITNASIDRLRDPNYLDREVRKVASAQSGKKVNRFEPIMRFLKTFPGETIGLVEAFIDDPVTVRRLLAQEASYMSFKTTSLWYLCLGGPELMALDRHNMRQLHGIGIDVPKKYSIGKPRMIRNSKTGVEYGMRNVTDSVRKVEEYEALESAAIERMHDVPWLHVDGYFSPARATCLFWYTGLLHGSEGGPYRRDANLVPVPAYSDGEQELPSLIPRTSKLKQQTPALTLDI